MHVLPPKQAAYIFGFQSLILLFGLRLFLLSFPLFSQLFVCLLVTPTFIIAYLFLYLFPVGVKNYHKCHGLKTTEIYSHSSGGQNSFT